MKSIFHQGTGEYDRHGWSTEVDMSHATVTEADGSCEEATPSGGMGSAEHMLRFDLGGSYRFGRGHCELYSAAALFLYFHYDNNPSAALVVRPAFTVGLKAQF